VAFVACSFSRQRPTHHKTVSCALLLLLLHGTAAPALSDAAAKADDAAERHARNEISRMISDWRASRGQPRLDRVPSLGRAATAYAEDMVTRRFFAHVSPEGSDLLDRVRACGYLDGWPDWQVGEVLAWGTGELSTPAAATRGWLESPPHRRMLNGRAYREMGVGVADGTPTGREGATYAVLLGSRGA
jgi:uncharacterized protein YkwD